MTNGRNDRSGSSAFDRALALPQPWWRYVAIGAGWLLLFVAPVIGLLPGPGGILFAAIATILLLRYSQDARRLFVRVKRRYPAMMWPLKKAVDRFRRRKLARGQVRP